MSSQSIIPSETGKKRSLIEAMNEKRKLLVAASSPPASSQAVPSPPLIVTAPTATRVTVPSSALPLPTPLPPSTKEPAPKKQRAPPKSTLKPHVLIWICHHGAGQNGKWTMKNPKVIGVYRSKEEAEQKKEQVMSKYDQCGYGDIMVGSTWNDEIDLLVRPVEECTLFET